MKVPYTLTHTPDGYQLDSDTRTAFMPQINVSVDAGDRAKALDILSKALIKELSKIKSVQWPEENDWMPGEGSVEVIL